MKKTKKLTEEEFMKSPDVQFFMDRLISILMQQVEDQALAKAEQNGNETQKVRLSQ